MNRKKIANKIASRFVESYLVLKIPVGYSLVKNAKDVLEHQTGNRVDDDSLEEIFGRFLDLVIFGLMKDVDNVGSSMPDADVFLNVAKEVLETSDVDEEVDFDDYTFDDEDQEGFKRF